MVPAGILAREHGGFFQMDRVKKLYMLIVQLKVNLKK